MEDATYFRALLEASIQKHHKELLKLQDLVQRLPALSNIEPHELEFFANHLELASIYSKWNSERMLSRTILRYLGILQLCRSRHGFERQMQVTHREITEGTGTPPPQPRRGFLSRLFGKGESE